MDPLDPLHRLTGPLRSLLGTAEHAEADLGRHSPLGDARALEAKLAEAVAAVHRAAKSTERQVAVLETLADSLPALTQSVIRLTDQLGELLNMTAPLATVERDVSRIGRFFGRRGGGQPPPSGGGEDRPLS